MFVQSAELVKAKQGDISRIDIYGQEKEPAAYRLAKMNLVLRRISHNLGDTSDSSFTHDLHRGLYFNYIMANPPFNLKGWYDENLKNDSRWADYMTPPESNANFAWILHMLSHLKPLDGVAGFLLANGALGDSDTLGADAGKELEKVKGEKPVSQKMFRAITLGWKCCNNCCILKRLEGANFNKGTIDLGGNCNGGDC